MKKVLLFIEDIYSYTTITTENEEHMLYVLDDIIRQQCCIEETLDIIIVSKNNYKYKNTLLYLPVKNDLCYVNTSKTNNLVYNDITTNKTVVDLNKYDKVYMFLNNYKRITTARNVIVYTIHYKINDNNNIRPNRSNYQMGYVEECYLKFRDKYLSKRNNIIKRYIDTYNVHGIERFMNLVHNIYIYIRQFTEYKLLYNNLLLTLLEEILDKNIIGLSTKDTNASYTNFIGLQQYISDYIYTRIIKEMVDNNYDSVMVIKKNYLVMEKTFHCAPTTILNNRYIKQLLGNEINWIIYVAKREYNPYDNSYATVTYYGDIIAELLEVVNELILYDGYDDIVTVKLK